MALYLGSSKKQKVNLITKIERYDEGYADGYEVGCEDGKKSEYDSFWNAYQKNGTRTDYAQAFYANGWNDITYNPKYDLMCKNNAYGIFGYSSITDTKKDIDITKALGTAAMFNGASLLKTIRKLIVCETTPFGSDTFKNCLALENLTVEGTIGQAIFNVQWSTKLNKASIASIVNALSATTTGLSVTLSLEAVNKAFETSEKTVYVVDCTYAEDDVEYQNPIWTKTDEIIEATQEDIESVLSGELRGTTTTGEEVYIFDIGRDTPCCVVEETIEGSKSDEWIELVAAKPNWTISLV
ncbi:MAG: hypothetical protein IJ370_04035 [Oscillospiraceae bacterium]|nr:hypothetical protein [Oscillospiraceae bacterium]MBQ8338545.1 hypothetical protein [Oscillospiraceae bacterium]